MFARVAMTHESAPALGGWDAPARYSVAAACLARFADDRE
jgi:hypothetical protein